MRVLKRLFYKIEGVELEVCTDEAGKRFVRHNIYWDIVYNKRLPNLQDYCVVDNLTTWVNQLDTIRWLGYPFEIETITFEDFDVEYEVVLIPLAIFADLMRWQAEIADDDKSDTARLGNYFLNRSKIEVKKQGRYLVPAEDVETPSERARRKLSSDEAIKTLQALVRQGNPEGNLISEELIRERRLEAANE